MKKFTEITSTCLLIETENIDTDQIIPAVFLKTTERKGLGKYLFYNWRFDTKGKPKKNPYFHGLIGESKKVLVAGNNFGCGSSREHAVWAIQDFGFKVVISSSFGDIFYNNAFKNGLLPVTLKPFELNQLFRIIEEKPETKITVDLEKQYVILGSEATPGSPKDSGQARMTKKYIIFHFPIDSFRKTCLLKGVDELGFILSFDNKIKDFEKSHRIFISA